jgi:fluoride ion exporter CrcB/FEX
MEETAVPLMCDALYALTIVLVMLTAGAIGGYASYHLNESTEKTKTKSITLGIVAATIVPVFLNTISSNLLVEAQTKLDKLFVFSGFCILASVFSRNFLENIYNKVLQQVGDIGKQVRQIEESASEPDIPAGVVPAQLLEENRLSETEFTLLSMISTGRFTYRSLSGLKKESGLERNEIDGCLNSMLAKKLIESKLNDKKQLRYFLSGEGRQLLGRLSLEQEDSA